MTLIRDLHAEWMKDPEYRKEYEALDEEFALIKALIDARVAAGLTQEQLAERMETSQSAIARLESGRAVPSGKTLMRFARATGTKLRISFEKPAKSTGAASPPSGRTAAAAPVRPRRSPPAGGSALRRT
jgi:transcriptional regulator with XRE-family HTH domain